MWIVRLVQQRPYTFIVLAGPEVRQAAGNGLRKPAIQPRRCMQIRAADKTSPLPVRWQVLPCARLRGPLLVDIFFPR
ncbi:hypothetical protein RM96_19475 [Cupriavidus sp. IDO]|nr:hypothetical protein RM96_19475 [Cupriavidus sp. IDO]